MIHMEVTYWTSSAVPQYFSISLPQVAAEVFKDSLLYPTFHLLLLVFVFLLCYYSVPFNGGSPFSSQVNMFPIKN